VCENGKDTLCKDLEPKKKYWVFYYSCIKVNDSCNIEESIDLIFNAKELQNCTKYVTYTSMFHYFIFMYQFLRFQIYMPFQKSHCKSFKQHWILHIGMCVKILLTIWYINIYSKSKTDTKWKYNGMSEQNHSIRIRERIKWWYWIKWKNTIKG
jgi:hypothetical protein